MIMLNLDQLKNLTETLEIWENQHDKPGHICPKCEAVYPDDGVSFCFCQEVVR